MSSWQKQFHWKKIDATQTELEGPYQCPACNGHVMFDATFLDQVSKEVTCPYCKETFEINTGK